jgi:hypothetical protein
MYSSISSSQKDGVSYTGQYEQQVSQVNQSQSSSYLPTTTGAYQANYYQSNVPLSGATNLQSSSSSFQSSFKSGTGLVNQSGSSQIGGSSFSSSSYSYKKQ